MKKISYRHKKIAAEKDAKDLNGVYFRAVRKDAEKDLPESPLGPQESRRDYFQRLNNLIETNKETYDDAAPFGRDAIVFVGTIPESELESLSKGDRLAFVKWVASNYAEYSGALTLENISKIRSFIDAHPEYTFLRINDYYPSDFISLMEEAEALVQENISDSQEDILKNLNINLDRFNDSGDILNNENIPDLTNFLSEREIMMLRAGASLTDKVNNLGLVLDFLFSENSDIEIKNPGDLEALYSFDFKNSESIINSFNALDQNQEAWHIKMADEAEKASSESGEYGYGYLTNIVIHQFSDGWKIVYLPANTDSEMVPWKDKERLSHDRIQEGDNNGLCLGSASKLYNNNDSGLIYSLRDPSNKPIATIRTKADFREKNDFSGKYVNFGEIRGKYNASVGIEASIYLSNFFQSVGIGEANYSFMLKDVSEKNLANIIEYIKNPYKNNSDEFMHMVPQAAEDIFSWISFLNKKRSDKQEAEKYKTYLKHYDSLIEVRNISFNDNNGLFFNTASIELDESRARKYILNICRKIIEAGNASFLKKELIHKFFSKGINSETFNKFYKNTLSKIPEYKRVLEILSKNHPEDVYYAICQCSYLDIDYFFEYGFVSAKILLSGGKESLDAFFSPLYNSGSVFFNRIKDFQEEYKNQNIIEYLERSFDQNEERFIEAKLFNYYFGNNSKIVKSKRKYINSTLEKHLALKEKQADDSPFTPSIMEYILSQGSRIVEQNLIDETLAYNVAKYIEKHINEQGGSWRFDDKSFIKYILFKKISGYKNELFEFSDEDAIEKTLDAIFKGIHNGTSIKEVSKKFIDFFDTNVFSLELISYILIPKLTQRIDNILEEKSIVKQLILKKIFNIITNHLSRTFNLNLDNLINKTSISNEEMESSFLENPKVFFETEFKDNPDLHELKKQLALLSLKNYFDSAQGYHSKFTLEYEAKDMFNVAFSFKEDREALDSLFNELFSHINDFNITEEEMDSKGLRAISGKIAVMSSFAEKLKEEKLLEKYAAHISNILSRFAGIISRFAIKDPKLFYSARMFSIPEVKVNRSEVAKALLERMIRDDYKYDEDLIPIILEDLGFSKQAKTLYRYFIKNNYLDEVKSLINIH